MGKRSGRRGATLVIVALALTFLLGIAAFAIDLSQMFAYRSELQRAVDAGAHAGAIQLTKPDYDSAAAVAVAFTTANLVFGRPPVIDHVDYGHWDNGLLTFTVVCGGLACTKDQVTAANAIRIVARETGKPVLAAVLGQLGFSIETGAIAWAAPTVERSDCVKPLIIPYTVLTRALNRARGLPDSYAPTRYPLDPDDLRIARDAPTALTVCLKEGVPGLEACNNAGSAIAGNFETSILESSDLGAGNEAGYGSELSSGCTGLGPSDIVGVKTGNMVAPTVDGTTTWCLNFGTGPCAMKAALWIDIAPAGSTATNGTGCKAVPPGPPAGDDWCASVRMIGSLVVTNVFGEPGTAGQKAVIEGHFAVGVDGGPLGSTNGLLAKPLLVQ
ncbi:MAG: pilus assembly protein [Gemmatimonadota bacterium]|nr:pilus assembly protein [Gemmatimonadota bacterium]